MHVCEHINYIIHMYVYTYLHIDSSMVIGLMTAGTKGTDNGCRYNSKDYTERSHIYVHAYVRTCL